MTATTEEVQDYEKFLSSKSLLDAPTGLATVPPLNPMLFEWQAKIVSWALRRGRAALLAGCGLGKSGMQLEWAHQICVATGGKVLIVAPLAVGAQTVKEGLKFGIKCKQVRASNEVEDGISITNYEMIEHFNPLDFKGIVIDESGCLKNFSGLYRKLLTEFASVIPFRLCATATPAPNDLIEIINHAEFLGVMSGKEAIALFFTQDGNTTHNWRLKGHARKDFYKWMASWAVAVRKPSDLGYPDGAFILPALSMVDHCVASPPSEGMLFALEAAGLQERQQARKASIGNRVGRAADVVATAPDEPWVVWCDLNNESEALVKAIPGAVELRGSDTRERKIEVLEAFADGRIRVLVTKGSIAGFGLNWQHCCKMVFVGLSDSFEKLYQSIRRCWRFGQTKPVDVHLIISEAEGAVRANLERKEKEAELLFTEIVKNMTELGEFGQQRRDVMTYAETTVKDADGRWTMHLGDCVEQIDKVETESAGLVLFSPPFPGMYAYTNSPRDIGNCKNHAEMLNHYHYLASKMLRVLMPGRMCCVHLTQSPAFKHADGYIGLKDFRGDMIRLMEKQGWIYYGEVLIDKDPQLKAQRTKDASLQFKSLATDSARMRMALADYLLIFKKPGDNPLPIRAGISSKYKNEDGWITNEEWIEWAAPVWYGAFRGIKGGIKESDVLNVRQARETDDERHLCPLQIGVIERAVKLWSNPGELVFTPFAGIGSELVGALRFNRRAEGIELKRSYFNTALQNVRAASTVDAQSTLFTVAQE